MPKKGGTMVDYRVVVGPRTVLMIAVLVLAVNCNEQCRLENCYHGVGFRFGTRGDTTGAEDFIAVTEDDEILASARAQLLVPVSERTLHIHGNVTFGNGGYNLDWDWHFIPADWVLAEESVEICDVRPSAIGMRLQNLPDTVDIMQACPLHSYVRSETLLVLTD